ncbi:MULTISPECIES: deoxynucleoside kinase [unclassified Arthrobacter]|uniref:deoxynucleoside kinase n=1 Tax=unclassified Arthrobacter TaxID=235627 RepID=UPI001CFF778D|nr:MULTISPECIES: deoxynucleoside kinase [unclassified Arthrobacter]MCB5281402.1 Deoxyadenosine/deoxycytidine kinase [Arthrobacter sp. ES1]WGZ80105.1 deoxynucleoside kinase [Arthrobacter sp. EM1]
MTVTVIKILGSIAAGKSTLAHALANDLDLTLARENPESNPFLPRMSEEPQRWCFANQVWYINEAVNSLHCRPGAGGLVADHSVEEVVDVHTPVFRANGWLDDEETKLLGELGAAHGSIADLYIWLDAPPDVLLDRVRARGRPADRVPEAEYLTAVANARREFLLKTTAPVLRIPSDEIDFRMEEARTSLVEDIRRLLYRERTQ